MITRVIIRNKNGSSLVMLAMVFVTLMTAIIAAISLTRALVVKSECECFGQIWAKAILSEYDIHLLDDYGIMAYQGDDRSVGEKLDTFMAYSCDDKLDASISRSYANLCGYELADPNNFLSSIKNSCASNIADLVRDGVTRNNRDNLGEEEETHTIKNTVVLDTLPSRGIENTIDIDSIVENIKSGTTIDKLESGTMNTSMSMAFMYKFLNNHITTYGDKPCLFQNEWEYVIAGKASDSENFNSCKMRLLLLRNALNLAALYEDASKVELIVAVAEMITPGPGAAVTQAVIAELWAAAESNEDIKTLLDGGRIPLMKTAESWKTDLGMIIDSDELKSKLDDEGKKLLEENRQKISEEVDNKNDSGVAELVDGLNYDEYLMVLMLGLNENVRLLRIMDVVQINMKYRYYDDFNMQEYYTGVGFTLKANGRSYEINEEYK